MENTLKVTGVLSDPTRFNIYEYLIKNRREVTVVEIAKAFDIHPNVARLHLTKLEDINLLVSFAQKTGKGGRPSRIYKLSDEVVELNFPHRDYKMLSTIALEAFVELGEPGKQALYNTGKKYGEKVMMRYQTSGYENLDIERKIHILEDAGTILGMYPKFEYNPENKTVSFKVNNCPFKEVASKNNNNDMICKMHHAYLKGMFESLFTEIELVETENMFDGCENCSYVAQLTNV
ncbi:helix-turn-helix transcriptional regulator [Ornithinibacillus halophilus]|uniref:Predicted transcriptional regulator, ArsR family n=1 Tax=Ornithinibacillus halophilus TaxID=930117 RepID=A0A1M5D1P7_9BACI|nr:helix-turn-helix domain-containing protein [Ornithinibacillus halophilus]SHF60834.1 Predicted transcriptional regulator, ArsR family [Ornithinibacillus halophilus]